MTITIDVPETLVHEAGARGIPVETLIAEKLADPVHPHPGFTSFRRGTKTVAEAVESLLERRKQYPLGDVTIKQLIEEGRRY